MYKTILNNVMCVADVQFLFQIADLCFALCGQVRLTNVFASVHWLGQVHGGVPVALQSTDVVLGIERAGQ